MSKQTEGGKKQSQLGLLNYISFYVIIKCVTTTQRKWITGEGKKKLFHVSVAWIMELGGQIKVWLSICGVILPPLTNTSFLLAPCLLFAFVSDVCLKVLPFKSTSLCRSLE